jgi:hypothetical protein
MKVRLLLANLGLLLYLAGLLITLDRGMQSGAIVVLFASALLGLNSLSLLFSYFKNSKLISGLAVLGVLFALSIIFMHGFSTSIDMMLLYNVELFTSLYLCAGAVLLVLFLYYSVKSTEGDRHRMWIIVGNSIAFILGIGGLLGFAGIAPVGGQLIFYSWVFMAFFYTVFFISALFQNKDTRTESIRLLGLSLVMVGFWIFRFNISALSPGLTKAIFDFAFVPLFILPLYSVGQKILLIYRFHFLFHSPRLIFHPI